MLRIVGNTPSLATVCQTIAGVHYIEQRLPEALDAIREAWKHVESSAMPTQQAYISLAFSRVLFSARKDTEA